MVRTVAGWLARGGEVLPSMGQKPNAKWPDGESQKLFGPWGVKEEPRVMFC